MSSTHDNLKEAFAGESQAFQKYTSFAEAAEKEGRPNIARLFRTTFAERGASLLDGADRWLASRQRQLRPRSAADAAPPVQVRLGVFLSESKVAAPTTGQAGKAAANRPAAPRGGRKARRSAR